MTSIEVDFEVFKALTVRRKTEATTHNDVIRELLRLPVATQAEVRPPTSEGRGWVSKGVLFPNGTEFRATHKGRTYMGRVDDNQFVLDGKAVTSPSEAAVRITGSAVNGWRFWYCRFPHETRWRRIDSLRG